MGFQAGASSSTADNGDAAAGRFSSAAHSKPEISKIGKDVLAGGGLGDEHADQLAWPESELGLETARSFQRCPGGGTITGFRQNDRPENCDHSGRKGGCGERGR